MLVGDDVTPEERRANATGHTIMEGVAGGVYNYFFEEGAPDVHAPEVPDRLHDLHQQFRELERVVTRVLEALPAARKKSAAGDVQRALDRVRALLPPA